VGAVASGESTPLLSLREIPATWKALYDLLVRRVPVS
jgi:hypothetical protein